MEHYSRFRREGLRVYANALQSHTDPYLPVLEDMVPNVSQLSRLSLGVQSIPMERVVGSVSQGRSYAFASNFMPILEGGSEFAGKWNALYDSVEQNGVNMPITCLEYFGDYYVIEGNKRVSVMKALGAREIDADVTRAYPEASDDPRYEAYQEYCDFSKETGLYMLLFTKPGSYAKLLSLPGVRAGDTWTQDEILSLRKVFSYFRIAYADQMKDKPAMKSGDAFLAYLIAFGYLDVRDEDMETTASHIRLMAKEFELRDNKVNLVMDPVPQQGSAFPLISSLFRPNKIKAAFLFNREIEASACTMLSQALATRNYEVGSLDLMKQKDQLLQNDALVIADPARDLSDEESATLRAWLAAGGRLLVSLSYQTDTAGLPNLTRILEYYQLAFGEGVVYENENETERYWNGNPLYLVPNLDPEHEITAKLAEIGSTNLIIPQGRPIQPVLMPESGTVYTRLLTTSDRASAVKGSERGEPGEQILAMAMLDADENREEEKDVRIVLMDSAYLLADSNLLYYCYNLNFTVTAVDWLINSSSTVDVSSKVMTNSTLSIPDSATANRMGIIAIGVLPLLVAVTGIIVWRRRRRL